MTPVVHRADADQRLQQFWRAAISAGTRTTNDRPPPARIPPQGIQCPDNPPHPVSRV